METKILTTNTPTLSTGMYIEHLRLHDLNNNEINLVDSNNIKVILSIPTIENKANIEELTKLDIIMQDYPQIDFFMTSNDSLLTLQNHLKNHPFNRLVITSDFKLHDFAKISGSFIYELETLQKTIMVINEHNKIIYTYNCDNLEDRFPSKLDI